MAVENEMNRTKMRIELAPLPKNECKAIDLKSQTLVRLYLD